MIISPIYLCSVPAGSGRAGSRISGAEGMGMSGMGVFSIRASISSVTLKMSWESRGRRAPYHWNLDSSRSERLAR